MPKRTLIHTDFSTLYNSLYRYGYQGSESDSEVKGEGNSYTTFYRMLDPRIGRWFSNEPKTSETPWESPYVSMGNNPIWNNDILGDKFRNGNTQKKKDASNALEESKVKLKSSKDMLELAMNGKTKQELRANKKVNKDEYEAYKTAKKNYKTAIKENNNNQIVYDQEELFEEATQKVLEEFKSSNPDVYKEWDDKPDIIVTIQKEGIKIFDENGNFTGQTTTEGTGANQNNVVKYSILKAQYITVNNKTVLNIKSMTSDLVHGFGHFVGNKHHDEDAANEYERKNYNYNKRK